MRIANKELKLRVPIYFRQLWSLLSLNLWTLVKFELIFKIATVVIFWPLVVLLFRLAMKVSGYSYITLENVFGFAFHPFTLFLGVIGIIIYTFLTVFDIGALLVVFDESYHGDRISLFSLVKNNFLQCAKLFRPKNIGVSFITLFLAPFLNIGFGSSILSNFRLPEFITDYIISNRLLVLAIILIYSIFLYIFMNWIYLIHYMVLERKSFRQARIASYRLAKGNRIGDLWRLLLAQLIFLGVLKLIIYSGSMGLRGLINLFSGHPFISSIVVSLCGLLLSIVSAIYFTFSNALNYSTMSTLFYRHKHERKEDIHEVVLGPAMKKKQLKNFHIWVAGFSALVFCGMAFWIYFSETGKLNLNVESLRELEISAHRGASVEYPENTMSAFQGAVDAGANWIELDVQQTKDGMIVVSHDASLKRTAGIRRNIYDMEYSELETVEVGGRYNGKYISEHIPTLAEVLIFAGEHSIKLNIELKPSGHEFEYEESVIDLINQYYRKDMCMISSLNYDSIKRVKEIDPTMQTLYTLSLASGNIEDFQYADAVSVEASSISSGMVRRVHNAGKEIFAWTVNSEESIYDMIDLGVDNIITDDVVKARGLVLEYKSTESVNRLWRMGIELVDI